MGKHPPQTNMEPIRREWNKSGSCQVWSYEVCTLRGICKAYMNHSLNSLKGGYIGYYIGDYYRGYLGAY